MAAKKSIREQLRDQKDAAEAEAARIAQAEAERLQHVNGVNARRDKFIETVVAPLFKEFSDVLNLPHVEPETRGVTIDGGHYTHVISLWFLDPGSNPRGDARAPCDHVIALAYRQAFDQRVHVF